MKYCFFKGCFIPIRHPHIEKVTESLLPEFGIELTYETFSCCPEPMGIFVTHSETGLAIAARNLALAEKKSQKIITLCNGCTYTLKNANYLLQEISTRNRINKILTSLDLEYFGQTQVNHIVEVFDRAIGLELLKEKTVKHLKDIKVATHTGCHILSPPDIMKYDDPVDPKRLDLLVDVIGAEALDYGYKTQCCGWTLSNFGERGSANLLLRDKLNAMHEEGADLIVVMCPQCLTQFDTGQILASRSLKLDLKIPVLHYVQLLALALGYSLEEIGYFNHRVKSKKLESKIGGLSA
jgi:heterodisulfide reductase subunit B